MNGAAEFNQVFLTDVEIPDEAVIGEVDGGWAVANTMLGSERGLVGDEWPGVAELSRSPGPAVSPPTRSCARASRPHSCARRSSTTSICASRAGSVSGEPVGALASIFNLFFADHLRRSAQRGGVAARVRRC